MCVCKLNVNANLWLCTVIRLNVLLSVCTHKSINCKLRLGLLIDPNLLKFLRFPIDLSFSGSDQLSAVFTNN